jgi:RNA methyltransferase, TrmH family
MITSSQNPRVKLVRLLLGRARERRQAGAFVAEGVRLVEEALTVGWPFRFVLFSEETGERGKALADRLAAAGVEVEQLPARLLASLSDTENTQGLLAVLEAFSLPLPADPAFLLIPDQVRDPGNLGSLLRSAAAAGVDLVLIPPETTDPFAPKVVRAGMGAHFRLPIVSMGWEEIWQFTDSGKLTTFLAKMGAPPCWQVDLTRPLALIVGGEAKGAGRPARELAAGTLSVPMPGGMESLNAAAAGAVLMFEVVRQRTQSGELWIKK